MSRSWPTMYNIRTMTGATPYIHFPGTAREALTFLFAQISDCLVRFGQSASGRIAV
jgi:hypothetical protein